MRSVGAGPNGAPRSTRWIGGYRRSIPGGCWRPRGCGWGRSSRGWARPCAIVCGGANNQLEEHDRDAKLLADRGVLYVPDFLANRMGIVNCANEQYGSFDGDRAIWSHLEHDAPTGIYRRCFEVFRRARASSRTPAHEAQVWADELGEEPHPLWGNRGQLIMDALVREGWAEQPPIAAT